MPFLDNRSLLMQNTSRGWHGVRKLTCPEGRYRRLFSVVALAPEKKKPLFFGIKNWMRKRMASFRRYPGAIY